MGREPGVSSFIFSLNDFMLSLWMSVSSSVSEGPGTDNPIDPFQLGSV